MIRALFVAAVVLSACGPASSGPDGGGGACLDTSKSPSNLIENPAFECDGASTWAPVYGTLDFDAPGRSGKAARVTVNGAGGRFSYAKTFAPTPGTKTYCFSAWLTGTAPFMRMRVLRDFDGSVQEVAFSEQVFPEFRKIPTLKVTADNAPKLLLVFEAQTNRADGMNALNGQTLIIDDVDVWESTANCTEAR